MFSKSPDLGDELFSKLNYCISVTWSDPRRIEHPVPHLVQSASIHAPSLLDRLYHHPGWQYIGAYILRRDINTL
jgi:hypothetical protein